MTNVELLNYALIGATSVYDAIKNIESDVSTSDVGSDIQQIRSTLIRIIDNPNTIVPVLEERHERRCDNMG